MELKDKILDCATDLFIKDGVCFNLDDIASGLSISKKTIYKYFRNKEDLLTCAVDKLFDDISKEEHKIYDDPDIDDIEKLKKIITALPENSRFVEVTDLVELNQKYPNVAARMDFRLSSGWDLTLKLIDEIDRKGKFRKFDIDIFKLMVTSGLEKIMTTDELKGQYDIAQQKMMDILFNGIIRQDPEKCKEEDILK